MYANELIAIIMTTVIYFFTSLIHFLDEIFCNLALKQI